ncbi:hypothetical protein EYF80_016679 [Liparis tanakae]|uniref:Uncharacterized protein n=1 Tax=Liparis tanakae TaxID=230148 RepID=A0A4Z2I7P1_9TELE|nr:hypothetical protein EYF80_016679 [Liparis tanakae]
MHPVGKDTSQRATQTHNQEESRGEEARRRSRVEAQALPALWILSQKAFSDLPTKLEARHQYFPACVSVTLDRSSRLWASTRPANQQQDAASVDHSWTASEASTRPPCDLNPPVTFRRLPLTSMCFSHWMCGWASLYTLQWNSTSLPTSTV